jgi:hypothetical protein
LHNQSASASKRAFNVSSMLPALPRSRWFLNALIINRDDIPKRTRCSLVHGGFLSLSWLR